MMLALHNHETGGTLAFLRRVPFFRGSQPPELYVRFQHARCSTGASLSVFQCRPARVLLIPSLSRFGTVRMLYGSQQTHNPNVGLTLLRRQANGSAQDTPCERAILSSDSQSPWWHPSGVRKLR